MYELQFSHIWFQSLDCSIKSECIMLLKYSSLFSQPQLKLINSNKLLIHTSNLCSTLASTLESKQPKWGTQIVGCIYNNMWLEPLSKIINEKKCFDKMTCQIFSNVIRLMKTISDRNLSCLVNCKRCLSFLCLNIKS